MKMKKSILLILVVIMLSTLFAGCDLFQSLFGNSLIGTWVYEIEGGNEYYLTKQAWEFKIDGTAIDYLTYLNNPDQDVTAGTDIINFTFVDDGDTVSLTYVSNTSNTGRNYEIDDSVKEYSIVGNELTFTGSDRVYIKE